MMSSPLLPLLLLAMVAAAATGTSVLHLAAIPARKGAEEDPKYIHPLGNSLLVTAHTTLRLATLVTTMHSY